jgi:hypothetical protein
MTCVPEEEMHDVARALGVFMGATCCRRREGKIVRAKRQDAKGPHASRIDKEGSWGVRGRCMDGVCSTGGWKGMSEGAKCPTHDGWRVCSECAWEVGFLRGEKKMLQHVRAESTEAGVLGRLISYCVCVVYVSHVA